jgi:hypothetical protein
MGLGLLSQLGRKFVLRVFLTAGVHVNVFPVLSIIAERRPSSPLWPGYQG